MKNFTSSSSFPTFAIISLVFVHYSLSMYYSSLFPWWGDEWYTYNGSTIMAFPYQLMVNFFKAILGPVNLSNYFLYRQIGSFFTLLLFLFLGYQYNANKDSTSRRFLLFSIIYVALSSFIFYQEQMFRYYSFYLMAAFIYFHFQLKYLATYPQHRFLFYLMLIISPFLHFFLGWQLAFYLLFQEYRALESKKRIRALLLILMFISITLIGVFWKEIMVFILPLAFGNMEATGVELRGLSLNLVLKPVLALFQFFLGNEVTPTENPFIIGLFIVLSGIVFAGFIRLLRTAPTLAGFFLLGGILPYLAMYLLLEPLTLPGSTQFESKHAIFFLPFLLYILSAFDYPKLKVKTFSLVFFVLLLSTGAYYALRSNSFPNWRTVAEMSKNVDAVLVDGRANLSFRFYAASENNDKVNLIWEEQETSNLLRSSQSILLVLNDYKSFHELSKEQMWNTGSSSKERYNILNHTLEQIEQEGYKVISSYSFYPLMAYQFEKSTKATYIPSFYEYAYADLHLPIHIDQDTILGWASLGAGDTLAITAPFYYFFESHLPNDSNSANLIRILNNTITNHPLSLTAEKVPFRRRYCRALEGYDRVADEWHKRPLLSGSLAYPGSYWPAQGFIFQFIPQPGDEQLIILDKNSTLHYGIQK